mmetsp:Transcript_2866/g.11515  ORF Transcript_2866/g.11515 Transcript_2866/m.11515 type:complete len:217 (-) Transcript_2866:5161-5811(-)
MDASTARSSVHMNAHPSDSCAQSCARDGYDGAKASKSAHTNSGFNDNSVGAASGSFPTGEISTKGSGEVVCGSSIGGASVLAVCASLGREREGWRSWCPLRVPFVAGRGELPRFSVATLLMRVSGIGEPRGPVPVAGEGKSVPSSASARARRPSVGARRATSEWMPNETNVRPGASADHTVSMRFVPVRFAIDVAASSPLSPMPLTASDACKSLGR